MRPNCLHWDLRDSKVINCNFSMFLAHSQIITRTILESGEESQSGTICGKAKGVSWWMEPLGRFPEYLGRILKVPRGGPSKFSRGTPWVLKGTSLGALFTMIHIHQTSPTANCFHWLHPLVLYKRLIQTGFGCYSSDFTLSWAFHSMRTQTLGEPPKTSSIALQYRLGLAPMMIHPRLCHIFSFLLIYWTSSRARVRCIRRRLYCLCAGARSGARQWRVNQWWPLGCTEWCVFASAPLTVLNPIYCLVQ